MLKLLKTNLQMLKNAIQDILNSQTTLNCNLGYEVGMIYPKVLA